MIDTIIGIAIIAGGGYLVYKMMFNKADINNDGKVDVADALTGASMAAKSVSEAAGAAVAVAAKAADVNNDGKVDVKDAVEVVKKTRGRKKKA